MRERCGCCGKGGANVVSVKPITAAGRKNPCDVVFCRICDRYDRWPNVTRKKEKPC